MPFSELGSNFENRDFIIHNPFWRANKKNTRESITSESRAFRLNFSTKKVI